MVLIDKKSQNGIKKSLGNMMTSMQATICKLYLAAPGSSTCVWFVCVVGCFVFLLLAHSKQLNLSCIIIIIIITIIRIIIMAHQPHESKCDNADEWKDTGEWGFVCIVIDRSPPLSRALKILDYKVRNNKEDNQKIAHKNPTHHSSQGAI
jgi:hypothetical protein